MNVWRKNHIKEEAMNIILSGIEKSFGGKPVIQHMSLSIRDGSFTTLLGPSGCGKTTLLRMIAGLETPESGTISLGNRIVYSREKGIFVPPEKRGLGFVFQDFALWPHMTVFENVAFGLRAAGRTDHLKEKVQEALAMVQLGDLAARRPDELSGGQQQRVAFARAVVTEPECILFDEPLSALDALLREKMRVEIRELVRRLGITAVFVTHDQAEAMSMSDDIAVIREGHIEQWGPPEEIYNHPATAFAARFVGSSNWIDSSRLFRPEKGSLAEAAGSRPFTASVVSSQFLGYTYRLHLRHDGKDWTIPAERRHSPGETVSIYVRPEDIVTVSSPAHTGAY